MLRSPALIPLSRQHQHALALCVMIERALPEDPGKSEERAVAHWESEAARLFGDEVTYHFTAEETILFPAAEAFAELRPLVHELRAEHIALRALVQSAGEHRLGGAGLRSLAAMLSGHVRKEERKLFEEMQRLIPADELFRLGAAVDQYFRTSGLTESCSLPFRKEP